jgi:hypothetical protein
MRRRFLTACSLFALSILLTASPAARAADDETIKKNLGKLSEADRKLAIEQKLCPIENELLGESGVPIKVTVKNQVIFLCCGGCKDAVTKDPEGTLKKVAELKKKNAKK